MSDELTCAEFAALGGGVRGSPDTSPGGPDWLEKNPFWAVVVLLALPPGGSSGSRGSRPGRCRRSDGLGAGEVRVPLLAAAGSASPSWQGSFFDTVRETARKEGRRSTRSCGRTR